MPCSVDITGDTVWHEGIEGIVKRFNLRKTTSKIGSLKKAAGIIVFKIIVWKSSQVLRNYSCGWHWASVIWCRLLTVWEPGENTENLT